MSIREEIIEDFKVFMVGPREEDEVLTGQPSSIYSTGILWPMSADQGYQNKLVDQLEGDDLLTGSLEGCSETVEDIEAKTIVTEKDVPATSALRPSSMGLSFYAGGVDFDISITGGCYLQDLDRQNWRRQDVRWTISLLELCQNNVQPGRYEIKVPNARLQLVVVVRTVLNERSLITVSLINICSDGDFIIDREFERSAELDESRFFQAKIQIQAKDSSKILPSPKTMNLKHDAEAASVELLYRKVNEFGRGHGVSCFWDQILSADYTTSLETTWTPSCKVPLVSAEPHPSYSIEERRGVFSADNLATLDVDTLFQELTYFTENYDEWITRQSSRIDQDHHRIDGSVANENLMDAAIENIKSCVGVKDALSEAVSVLRNQDNVRQAFQYANEAMALQFSWQEDQPALLWRPFQLAFVLLSIPSIVNPEHPDRKKMELLWFPTGGGKTEAYLFLTAFVLFFRRLNNGANWGRQVDVIMRYTLRLLTTQQFERATAMIVASDIVRRDRELGGENFSIGLYVGSKVTPNDVFAPDTDRETSNLEDCIQRALEQDQDYSGPDPLPLKNCPVCKSKLEINGDPSLSNIILLENEGYKVYCSQPNCQIGNPCIDGILQNDNLIPIEFVDSQIYDRLPSLLIATVDKFAQLPNKTQVSKLLGRGAGQAPALIIQDELHLISGELGSVVGAYEAAIDYICSMHPDSNKIPPKVIGSTATIARANSQVRGVFDRETRLFPPSCIDIEDSYFAHLPAEISERRYRTYIGATCMGRSGKWLFQTAAASLMHSANLAVSRHGNSADPWFTLLCYFNSIRELSGSQNIYNDMLTNTFEVIKREGEQVRNLDQGNKLIEITSRRSAKDIPVILGQLATPIVVDAENRVVADGQQFVHCAMATNMISVGMDVSRLSLMLVNGRPKTTSEYIQASSRVGRKYDGLVMTCLNAFRPRDLSHFETFQYSHSQFYKDVEPTSVSPWTLNTVSKCLPAIMTACIRNTMPDYQDVPRPEGFQSNEFRNEVSNVVAFVKSRASLWLRNEGLLDDSANSCMELDHLTNETSKFFSAWADNANLNKYYYRINADLDKALLGSSSNGKFLTHIENNLHKYLPRKTPNSMRTVEPNFSIEDKDRPIYADYGMAVGSARVGQFLYDYGIGGFYEVLGGTFMTMGTDSQNSLAKAPSRDNQRLAQMLGVSSFKIPNSIVSEGEHAPLKVARSSSVLAKRFPKWYLVPSTNSLRPIEELVCNSSGENPPQLKDRDGNEVVPARFVLIYDPSKLPQARDWACQQLFNGAVGDFPWVDWCHLTPDNQAVQRCDNPELKLISRGRSNSLDDLWVRCSNCYQVGQDEFIEKVGNRSMAECFKVGQLNAVAIEMYKPWLSDEAIDVTDQNLNAHLRQRLRVTTLGASSNYVPLSQTVVDIPLLELSPNQLERAKSLIQMFMKQGAAQFELNKQTICQLIGGVDIDDLEAIKSIYFTDGNVDNLHLEYRQLQSDSVNNQRLSNRVYEIQGNQEGYFSKFCSVTRLVEASAMYGFLRGSEQVSQNTNLNVLIQGNGRGHFAPLASEFPSFLPYKDSYGEGVFIEFCLTAVEDWEQKVEVINRVASLSAHIPGFDPPLSHERYVLLHTFSHALLRVISAFCGYPCAALKERVYASPTMAGILIYTTTSDMDGTLGGLMRLAEPSSMNEIIETALSSVDWCSNDPLCGEISPQQQGERASGAACHSCLLVPETSCERFNTLLDRKLLVGDEGLSFFSKSYKCN